MSEKIDEIALSNVEIKQSYKSLLSLMKGFITGCSLLLVLLITSIIGIRSDVATIKAVLATKDNINTLRDEIRSGDLKLHNEIGSYMSICSYIAIESQRAVTAAALFYDFGILLSKSEVHIKEEELEKFRTTALFKLNSGVKLGTTRGV